MFLFYILHINVLFINMVRLLSVYSDIIGDISKYNYTYINSFTYFN